METGSVCRKMVRIAAAKDLSSARRRLCGLRAWSDHWNIIPYISIENDSKAAAHKRPPDEGELDCWQLANRRTILARVMSDVKN